MHGANYRDGRGQLFTRKEYIKGKPQNKIAKKQPGKTVTNQNRDQNIEAALLKKALEAYSKDKQVQLITASIPSEQNATSLLLQKSGFCFIDLSFSIRYCRLAPAWRTISFVDYP